MATRILGFSCDKYARYSNSFDMMDEKPKNVIPLEDMTPDERYELALSDDEDVSIWYSLDSFLYDLNDQVANINNMFVYKYSII